MSRNHYDYIVIGGGSGGYAAARTARETREHVAIVDGSEILGGLCILNGCMPSKTLIYSAELLHLAKKGKHLRTRSGRPQGSTTEESREASSKDPGSTQGSTGGGTQEGHEAHREKNAKRPISHH